MDTSSERNQTRVPDVMRLPEAPNRTGMTLCFQDLLASASGGGGGGGGGGKHSRGITCNILPITFPRQISIINSSQTLHLNPSNGQLIYNIDTINHTGFEVMYMHPRRVYGNPLKHTLLWVYWTSHYVTWKAVSPLIKCSTYEHSQHSFYIRSSPKIATSWIMNKHPLWRILSNFCIYLMHANIVDAIMWDLFSNGSEINHTLAL